MPRPAAPRDGYVGRDSPAPTAGQFRWSSASPRDAFIAPAPPRDGCVGGVRRVAQRKCPAVGADQRKRPLDHADTNESVPPYTVRGSDTNVSVPPYTVRGSAPTKASRRVARPAPRTPLLAPVLPGSRVRDPIGYNLLRRIRLVGLWRSLGKRVGCKPSRVRISYPPPVDAASQDDPCGAAARRTRVGGGHDSVMADTQA